MRGTHVRLFCSSQIGQTEMGWPEEEQSICWSKDAEDGNAGRISRAGASRPSPHRLQFGHVFVLKAQNLFTKESGSSGESTVYLIVQKSCLDRSFGDGFWILLILRMTNERFMY